LPPGSGRFKGADKPWLKESPSIEGRAKEHKRR
jgi:hypothetical protein